MTILSINIYLREEKVMPSTLLAPIAVFTSVQWQGQTRGEARVSRCLGSRHRPGPLRQTDLHVSLSEYSGSCFMWAYRRDQEEVGDLEV